MVVPDNAVGILNVAKLGRNLSVKELAPANHILAYRHLPEGRGHRSESC
jgi:hypothetical protein